MFCSFDSVQSFDELKEVVSKLKDKDLQLHHFFFRKPGQGEMQIPDLGKGFLQTLLKMEDRELKLILSIVELWNTHSNSMLQALSELISEMTDEVGREVVLK